MRVGFDRDLYIKTQTEHILKRIEQFDNKLYLNSAASFSTITTRRECCRVLMLTQK